MSAQNRTQQFHQPENSPKQAPPAAEVELAPDEIYQLDVVERTVERVNNRLRELLAHYDAAGGLSGN